MLTDEANKLTFNRAQLTSILHNSPKEVKVWGRGTGKSTHYAWKKHKLITTMPRSASVITGATYAQLLTRTLPPVIEALERLGYYKDLDYFIGRKPPVSWRWPEPWQPPLSYDRFILFRTGAGFHLTSQDREGTSRGLNIDYILCDEMLTLDQKKLEEEVFAANRGNLDRFSRKHLHHGYDMASSMPTSAAGNWILNYGDYYEDDGMDIWRLWNKITQLQLEFIDSHNPTHQKELVRDINELRKNLRFYPKNGVLFSVFNVFDNVRNVGVDYIKQMRRQMTNLAFRVEMLNERFAGLDDGFYNIQDKHLYEAPNYSYIDALEFNFEALKTKDSRHDADVDADQPLDISIDFGGSINAMAVAQPSDKSFNFINGLYVKPPQGISDLIAKFSAYYTHHRAKTVNLWYDHTAKGNYGGREQFIEEATRVLSSLGWTVNPCYIGVTPDPESRYLLWYLLLRQEDDRFPEIQFNKSNCKELLLSMQLAPIKAGEKGFKKDKGSERKKKVAQEHATHFSDAADTIAWGRFHAHMDTTRSFVDVKML